MSAIELLLAAGDTVEKLHQSAWWVLLRETKLLRELGVELPEPWAVKWGRGLSRNAGR